MIKENITGFVAEHDSDRLCGCPIREGGVADNAHGKENSRKPVDKRFLFFQFHVILLSCPKEIKFADA
jgi:hypothetical protein